MTDSPDRRGIDVALLYQPALFKPPAPPEHTHRAAPQSRAPHTRPSYTSAACCHEPTQSIYWCATCPRKPGNTTSNGRYRKKVAQVLKHTADSLARLRQNATTAHHGGHELRAEKPLPEVAQSRTAANRGRRPASAQSLRPAGAASPQPEAGYLQIPRRMAVAGPHHRIGQPAAPRRRLAHLRSPSPHLFAPFLLAKSGPYSDPVPLRTYKENTTKAASATTCPSTQTS